MIFAISTYGVEMSYINRMIDIIPLVRKGTVFLFGPRQTGKSTYIRHEILPLAKKSFSLLDQGLLLRLKADPTRLRQEIEAEGWRDCLIVIDEVQKCPELLDEVHYLIEERGIRFLLTGSDTRGGKFPQPRHVQVIERIGGLRVLQRKSSRSFRESREQY